MTHRVSIVIPVYNAGCYLRQCLDSVLGQTLRDIEVICVDDGSTDGSAAVLAEYVAKDNRVVLLAQKNSGQGMARNYGLERAVGKYVYFMDADDELASADALERLVCEADRGQLDALFFDAETTVDAGFDAGKASVNPKDYVREGNYSGIYDGSELFARFLKRNEYCVCLWIALFRREFLSKCGIRFPNCRIFHEDDIFMTRVMIAAARTSHRPWRLYRRKVHMGSSMASISSPRHLDGYRMCYDEVCGLLERGGLNRRLMLALKERRAVYLLQIHRLEGTVPSLKERMYRLYIRFRCRGFVYMVKHAFGVLCRRCPS